MDWSIPKNDLEECGSSTQDEESRIKKMVVFSDRFCIFCLKKCDDDDMYELGIFYSRVLYGAHYLCVLTASNLYQGPISICDFHGFRARDIMELKMQILLLNCVFCGQHSPAISCNGCGVRYHLPCGIKHGCRTIMMRAFDNFCRSCYRTRYPELLDSPPAGKSCSICLTEFESNEEVYKPKCCNADAFIHILCLKKMAFNAGYATKCPFCSNTKIFRGSIQKVGVLIPNREPSYDI